MVLPIYRDSITHTRTLIDSSHLPETELTLRNHKNANLPTVKLPICLYSSFLAAAAAASSAVSLALVAPPVGVSVGVAVSYVPVGVGDGFGAV